MFRPNPNPKPSPDPNSNPSPSSNPNPSRSPNPSPNFNPNQVHLAATSCATVLVDQLLLPGYHPSLRVAALGAICRMLEIIELRQTLYEGKAPARLALLIEP